jgi:hypothetical protein
MPPPSPSSSVSSSLPSNEEYPSQLLLLPCKWSSGGSNSCRVSKNDSSTDPPSPKRMLLTCIGALERSTISRRACELGEGGASGSALLELVGAEMGVSSLSSRRLLLLVGSPATYTHT